MILNEQPTFRARVVSRALPPPAAPPCVRLQPRRVHLDPLVVPPVPPGKVDKHLSSLVVHLENLSNHLDQNTAATNSSCLRLTNYGSRGLNSCQIYWDDCRQFTFPLPLLPTIALPCDLWPRALPPKISYQFCLKEGIINGWIFLLLSFDTPAMWPNISNCLLTIHVMN